MKTRNETRSSVIAQFRSELYILSGTALKRAQGVVWMEVQSTHDLVWTRRLFIGFTLTIWRKNAVFLFTMINVTEILNKVCSNPFIPSAGDADVGRCCTGNITK